MRAPSLDDSFIWTEIAARAASDKKARRIIILDVSDVLAITDAFVIASAPNDRQVRAVADEIQSQISLNGGPAPTHIEGREEGNWILLDYGTFIIHVFLEEAREYYDIERLWADVPHTYWIERELASANDR